MNSRALSIFVSFMFLCLASSTVLSPEMPSTETPSLNRQLQKTSLKFQRGYLYLTLAAASTGHNLVKVPEPVTKECTRIALTIMNLFSRPSTHPTTVSVLDRSVDKTIDTLKSHTNQSLIQVLCNFVNEEALKMQSNNFNFEAGKQNARPLTPHETQNYFTAIPQNQTVDQYMESGGMIFQAYAKQLIKFGTIRAFHLCEDEKSLVEHRDCMVAATAIHQLSGHKNRMIREHVDKMFADAFEIYYNTEVYSQTMDEYNQANTDYAATFARILSNFFRADRRYSLEKQLYERIANEAVRQSKTRISDTENPKHQHEL